jgi:hypothetical protein
MLASAATAIRISELAEVYAKLGGCGKIQKGVNRVVFGLSEWMFFQV